MSESAALPTIPGYDLVEQIDVGGFSRVFRAIQRRFDRPVAIKVLNAGFTDERQRRAFERECRVMGQLSSHPNIVTVYDSAVAELAGHELPAIVMELYTGTYRNAGRLSIPEVVDVGVKIADALDHIHRQAIVHRDLKPHNLFISQHGEPAIADFGISTIGGEHTTGARFTLKYAPPELLREGVADAAGDIYSLGATLFQLATGRVPFDGPDDAEVVRQVMVAPPPRLDRSDGPSGLERIIHRCLAKYPSERPGSAGEVAEAFRRLQSEVGLPGRRRPVTDLRVDTGPDRHFTRSRDGAGDAGDAGGSPTGTVDRHGREPRPGVTDDAVARPTPGRRIEADAEVDAGEAAAPADSRRGLVAALAALLVLVAGAAIVIAVSSGDGGATSATTVAATNRLPEYEILGPPRDLGVVATRDGFEFRWTADRPGTKVRLQRVGSDDSVIADRSPFLWRLAAPEGDACFEARTVDADETRLSQLRAGPVCAG